MTLVVGIVSENTISLISDTALTRAVQYLSNNPPFVGTLKSIILGSELCICFAGTADYGISAIRLLEDSADHLSLDDILDILFKEHTKHDSDEAPDFIVASLKNNKPILCCIQHGKVQTNLQSCWIGNKIAFTRYQELFHQYKVFFSSIYPIKTHEAVSSAMLKAMGDLIDEGVDDSVGGFSIAVTSKENKFQYISHAAMIGLKRDQIITEEWTTVKFGGASDGGYAYSVLRPDNTSAAIGIHIYQIRLGIFYSPLKMQLPIVIKGLSPSGFIEFIKQHFGVSLTGFRIGTE